MVASELESVANSISTIWALFTFTFTNMFQKNNLDLNDYKDKLYVLYV